MTSNQEEQDYIDFQQYWSILKRRWLPITIIFASVFGLSTVLTLTQKPIYEAEGKLRLDKNNSLSSLTGVAEKVGEISGVTNLSNPLETEAEIIRSNPLVEKVISDLALKDKEGKPLRIESFLKPLKVKSVKGTDVLQISYNGQKPEEAARVINTLMDIYLKNNIENNRKQSTAARVFLDQQLPQVEKQVAKAEADVRLFKDKYQVVALDEEAKVGVASIKGLSDDITRAQSELAAANSRSEALQGQLKLNAQQAVALSTLSQTPGVQQVLTEYQKVQDQLAVERSRLTDEHPTITNLLKKTEALKKQLQGRVAENLGDSLGNSTGNSIEDSQSLSEKNLQIGELKQTLTADLVRAEVEKLASVNRLNVLEKSLEIYKGRLGAIPKLEEKQRGLERKLLVAQSTYQQLLKQLQEVRVIENQNVGNARVVSLALVPDKPISPKVPLNLALGGFLGILLGAGTALVLEAMDKSLKTLDETKRLLDYPLLGAIPLVDKKVNADGNFEQPELSVLNNPYSPVSASFEMLQTNLGLSISDKTLKVIAISSSIPGEGKSFVSANLAVAMAQLGKRVLLIDADMRRSRQHEVWQIPNLKGLANVLTNQTELRYATQEALVTLEVLTAGTTPPNPLALLDSQKMADLVQKVSEEYDFVIIDAPPLTAVADPLTIGKYADGMLLVVRPGVGTRETVSTAKSLLEQAGQRVLGMVVNGVTTQHGYGGYYYSKGYYGNRNKDEQLSSISTSKDS
jgi:capsular exopolysaccharide synthesis family protein